MGRIQDSAPSVPNAVAHREAAFLLRVLAVVDGRPVLAREGRFLVAAFHPELTEDTTVHEYFLQMCASGSRGAQTAESTKAMRSS